MQQNRVVQVALIEPQALMVEAQPEPQPSPSEPPPPEQPPIPSAPKPVERTEPPPQEPRPEPASEPRTEPPAKPLVIAESAPPSTFVPTAPVDFEVEEALVEPSFHADYLYNPAPVYPRISRRLREQGEVNLRVLVSHDGRPLQVELYRSSGHKRLDLAAQDVVARWQFVPARRGSRAVESWVIVPIVFGLDS